MGGMTVLSGPERRRRWDDESRVRVLEEAFAPGACVAHVARRHDVSTGLLYTWRKKLRCAPAGPDFVEAVVIEEPNAVVSSDPAVMVELSHGGRVSISASTPPALAAAVLKALR